MENQDYKNGQKSLGKLAGSALKHAVRSSSASLKTAGAATIMASPVGWIILVVVGILLVMMIFLLLLAYNPPSSSLGTQSDNTKVSLALEKGYHKKKEEALGSILDKINADYNITGSKDNTEETENGYLYSGDNYDIEIVFTPETEDFSNYVSAYANSVNSVISAFGYDDSDTAMYGSDLPEGSLVDYDSSTGSYTPSDILKNSVATSNSEYINSDSDAFYQSIEKDSSAMFEVEENPDEWLWELEWSETTITSKKCYLVTYTRDFRSTRKIKQRFEVSCSGKHDEEETEETVSEHLYGSVTVNVDCDVTGYKKDIIKAIKDSLIGEERMIPHDEDGKTINSRVVIDEKLADDLVNDAIDTYMRTYDSTVYGS